MTNCTRHILFVAALVASAITAATATAGTVQVKSCADAPTGGADSAWQTIDAGVGGYETPEVACPPTGADVGGDLAHSQILGRSIWTRLNSGVAVPASANGQVRFTAPTGTTISAVHIKRDIGKRSDGYRIYGTDDLGDTLDPTCAIPSGDFTCSVGGYGAGYADFATPNVQWVAWGFRCGDLDYTTCLTGTELHQAWAHVYGAVVTLTDTQVPTGVSAGGTVTSAGWKRGSVAGTISGTDNLGVRNVRWYADGTVVSTSADRACDYSTTVPCTNASGVSYALSTTGLTDGSHDIRAAVVDPAGNETKGAQFGVQVDNTPPPSPSALHVTGGGSSSGFSATWINPAPDGGAPYVGSGWEACSSSGCTSGSGGLTSAAGSLPVGVSTVKVWLVDEAGNAGHAVTGSLAYAPPAGGGGGSSAGGGGGGGGSSATMPTSVVEQPAALPVPISSTPPPTPTVPATRVVDPVVRLRVATLVRRTGRLTLTGSAAPEFGGVVRVAVRVRTAGGVWKRKASGVVMRRGSLSATIVLPTAWTRSARAATVEVRWDGAAGFAAGAVSRTVRLR
jgi:hypothetical protein